ncbi:MAG: hypothetical protein H7329_02895 [Opitutaceae bacterium]|nr:hypothetical protein [Cytophagales bacterium]
MSIPLNNSLKRLIFPFICLATICCTKSEETKSTTVDTTAIVVPVKPSEKGKEPNCYDYLTELVRSSNFPFRNIDKAKANLLIDKDENGLIFAKIYFDTEGTGTLGWVNYNVKSRTLENASAYLESPEKLTFDGTFAESLETCLGINYNPKPQVTASLQDAYNQSSVISLPNSYDYDFLLELKGFVKLSTEIASTLKIKGLENIKIAKLPIEEVYQPILLAGKVISGQSQLFLLVLDKEFNEVSRLKLYDSKEINGASQSTTYSISSDYQIELKQSNVKDNQGNVGQSDIKISIYRLSKDGQIIEVK